MAAILSQKEKHSTDYGSADKYRTLPLENNNIN